MLVLVERCGVDGGGASSWWWWLVLVLVLVSRMSSKVEARGVGGAM